MLINNNRYIINVKDANSIVIRNVITGESKRLFKVEQIADYIKSDLKKEHYTPEIIIDGQID